MRALVVVCVLLSSGCRSMPSGLVVTGSAYVEAERPDGKAVAKIEVHYRPPVAMDRTIEFPHASLSRPPRASLGEPFEVETQAPDQSHASGAARSSARPVESMQDGAPSALPLSLSLVKLSKKSA